MANVGCSEKCAYNINMGRPQAEKYTFSPASLRWARTRARLDTKELAAKLKVRPEQVDAWEENGEMDIPKAYKLAEHTLTPFGYFFYETPPTDIIDVADFRYARGSRLNDASPELCATMLNMQQRQEWSREARIEQGDERLNFVSSFDLKHASPEQAAAALLDVLHLSHGWQVGLRVSSARRKLFEHMERAGLVTVINGVVDNKTNHKLDPAEFRGFALVDEYAPLVFVNGNDALTAQMFTLAHESAHILIGESGVSLCDLRSQVKRAEKFCNSVAAEFLVPASMFKRPPLRDAERVKFIERSAERFCVSRPVIAHRAHELQMLSKAGLEDFYRQYDLQMASPGKMKSAGGDFWSNQKYRIGHRFGDSVVRGVLSGKLQWTEAWLLTGLNRATFDKYLELRRDHL